MRNGKGRKREEGREREGEKRKREKEMRTYRRQTRNALHDTFKSPPNCFNPLTGGDKTTFETATSLFLTIRYLNSPRLRFSPRRIRILKRILGLSHGEFRQQRARSGMTFELCTATDFRRDTKVRHRASPRCVTLHRKAARSHRKHLACYPRRARDRDIRRLPP